MVTHWVCNFAIGQLFLSAVAAFGVPAVYLFFAAICFACVGFVRRSVVETKGCVAWLPLVHLVLFTYGVLLVMFVISFCCAAAAVLRFDAVPAAAAHFYDTAQLPAHDVFDPPRPCPSLHWIPCRRSLEEIELAMAAAA